MATCSIDSARSSVGFSVRHMMFARVRGHFAKWTAGLEFDEADLTRTSVEASIDTGSVDTRDSLRDAQLRSADFFDAEKHPHMTYKSTRIERAGAGRYKMTGDLTIRGVTHEVVLDVEEVGSAKGQGNQRVLFRAKGSINRADWGLKFQLEAGGVLVSEKVDVDIEIAAVKPRC
jgi:polyisoprenoid-binding protein YceI